MLFVAFLWQRHSSKFGDNRVRSFPSQAAGVSPYPARVAFTVYLDYVVSHLAVDQVIPFNKILLNEGSAFNVSSGKFLCPQSGIYLFSFNLHSEGLGLTVAKLVVDGINQLDGISTNLNEMGGNTAVLRLTAGQSVWVANYLRSDVELWDEDGYRYTSFSGVLL